MIEGAFLQELKIQGQPLPRSGVLQAEYLETLEALSPYFTFVYDDPQGLLQDLLQHPQPVLTIECALEAQRAQAQKETQTNFAAEFSLLRIQTMPNAPARFKTFWCASAHRSLLEKAQILLPAATPSEVLASCQFQFASTPTLPAVPFSCLHQRKITQLQAYADEMGACFAYQRKSKQWDLKDLAKISQTSPVLNVYTPEYGHLFSALEVRRIQADYVSQQALYGEPAAFDLEGGPAQTTAAPPVLRRTPNELVKGRSKSQLVRKVDWTMTPSLKPAVGEVLALNDEPFVAMRICWQELENRVVVRVLGGRLYQGEAPV